MLCFQVALMLTTWHTCVKNSNCPALPQLPSISNTWDDPPGNYLSRFIVGNVGLMMGLLQFVLWLPEKKAWKINLALAVIGCICLSLVGAICDSASDKQCRGDNKIHSTFAVVFFVLYNYNMSILTAMGSRWKAIPILSVRAILFNLLSCVDYINSIFSNVQCHV